MSFWREAKPTDRILLKDVIAFGSSMTNDMKTIIVSLIEFYQKYLSFDQGALRVFAPGGACRYPVACSEYMKQSIIEYGVLKGGSMGVKRILSCNPWN